MEENKINAEDVLVYIPCLNTSKTIEEVLKTLKKENLGYSILIVDNNSGDNNLDIAVKTIKENNIKKIHIIRNLENLGYGGSQKVALFFAIYNGFKYMLVLHGDAQYPIENISTLIHEIKKNNLDLVIGSRLNNEEVKKVMPRWRYFGNSLITRFSQWAYSTNLTDINSEYKIYNLEFMKKIDINKLSNNSKLTLDILLTIIKSNGKIKEITIPCSYHKNATHPATFDLLRYVIYTFYRALFFKLFNR